MLIDGLEMGYVSGFGYRIVRPVPEDRVPFASSVRRIFQQKYWREQLRDWNETFKPTLHQGSPSIAVGRSRRSLR